MKKLLLIIGLVLSLSATEQTSKLFFVNKIDPFTDIEKGYIVYEDKNHKIEMGVKNNLWFIITRKKMGFIKKDSLIQFRVDKNKVYETKKLSYDRDLYNTLNKDLREIYISSNKTVAFNFFNLTGEFPKSLHCEMLKGNFLNIRYSTDSIYYEDIKISLKGISKIYKQIYGKKAIPYTNADCK